MSLKRTLDYIKALKARYGSDYKSAQELGIAKSAISIYRNKGGTFDDTTAIKAAELLQEDPGLALIYTHAERAKDEKVRQVWQQLAERLQGTSTAVMLAILATVGMTVFPSPSMASSGSLNETGYTLCEVTCLATSLGIGQQPAAARLAAGQESRACRHSRCNA